MPTHAYCREYHLTRLITVDPKWLHECSPGQAGQIRSRLRRLLRRQYRRAQTGHWSFCPARYRALLAALQAEERLCAGN